MLRMLALSCLIINCFGTDECSLSTSDKQRESASSLTAQQRNVPMARHNNTRSPSNIVQDIVVSFEEGLDPEYQAINLKVQAVPMEGFAIIISEFKKRSLCLGHQAGRFESTYCLNIKKGHYKWLYILCKTEDKNGKLSQEFALSNSLDGQPRISIKRATATKMQYLCVININLSDFTFGLIYK